MAKKSREAGEFEPVEVNVGRWRMPLTPREAARGVLALQRNVRRLVTDAVLLLGQRRNASATSLAILAYEEAAKSLTLALLAAHDNGRSPWH